MGRLVGGSLCPHKSLHKRRRRLHAELHLLRRQPQGQHTNSRPSNCCVTSSGLGRIQTVCQCNSSKSCICFSELIVVPLHSGQARGSRELAIEQVAGSLLNRAKHLMPSRNTVSCTQTSTYQRSSSHYSCRFSFKVLPLSNTAALCHSCSQLLPSSVIAGGSRGGSLFLLFVLI